MEVEQLAIDGPLLLTPRVFEDDRGWFAETWNSRTLAAALDLPAEQAPCFVQDNQSRSRRGVLRGLHYQIEPEAQAKLVRCVAGEIFDVAVDLRRSSPSFGAWVGVHLTADNHQQLWVPMGFAHGFLTLSDSADVLYKASAFWSRSCERSLRWDDPSIGIHWPLERLLGEAPLLAAKDVVAPLLPEAIAAGDVFA